MQQSDELNNFQIQIEKFEKQLEGTTDLAKQTALITMLAAMRGEKVLTMQSEHATAWVTGCRPGVDLALNPR